MYIPTHINNPHTNTSSTAPNTKRSQPAAAARARPAALTCQRHRAGECGLAALLGPSYCLLYTAAVAVTIGCLMALLTYAADNNSAASKPVPPSPNHLNFPPPRTTQNQPKTKQLRRRGPHHRGPGRCSRLWLVAHQGIPPLPWVE